VIRRAGVILAFVVACAGPGNAQELRLPEGAVLTHSETVLAARLSLPVGPFAPGAGVPTRMLEGRLDHAVWQVAPAQTVAVLLATLRAQVLAAGYEVLLDCTARDCGGYDFRFAVPDLGAPVMLVDLGRYGYLSAEQPDTGAHVMVLVSETQDLSYVQITRITPLDLALPMGPDARPALDPSAVSSTAADEAGLAARMATSGAVVLEDLEFATGSAELSNTAFPSLRDLAAFLGQDPARAVVLVGHSDAQGATETNLALSLRRAEAVRDRLISEFGVEAGQLRADGVGYLAPRASNATEEGRRANRRVEAVLVLP
jgi:OOP family OmpA-OmpF porin